MSPRSWGSETHSPNQNIEGVLKETGLAELVAGEGKCVGAKAERRLEAN